MNYKNYKIITNALSGRLRVGAGLGASSHGISPLGISPHGISPRGVSQQGISQLGISPHVNSPLGVSPHVIPPRGVLPRGILPVHHMESRQAASVQSRTWRKIMASFGVAWVWGFAPVRSGIWPHLPKIITKLQNNYKRKIGKIGHSKRFELQKLQNNYKRTFRPAAGRGRTWRLDP